MNEFPDQKEENGKSEEPANISSEELECILNLHQKWLDSEGKIGEKANLNGTNLRWVDLTGKNLRLAALVFSDFQDADLAGAKIIKGDLRFSNFTRSMLQHANLEEALLSYSNFEGAHLLGINLEKALLGFTKFQNVTFYYNSIPQKDSAKEKFYKKIVENSYNDSFFTGNLREAQFEFSDMRGGNFPQVDLYRANLSYANLECHFI